MSNERNHKAELASIVCQMGWHGGRAASLLMVGPPGTAKTRFAEILRAAFSKKLGYEVPLSAMVLPQTQPEELSGVNVPNEKRTEVNRLPLALLKRLTHSDKGHGIFLGDELTSASSATGAACMTIASDGRAGDITLDNKVSRIFAMNPPEQAANARELTPPEANRFVWINDWNIPRKDYFDYLQGGEGLGNHVKFVDPEFEKTFGIMTSSWVIQFLERNPKMLNELANKVKKVEDCQSGAWASERSWELCARVLAAVMSAEDSSGSRKMIDRARSSLAQLAVEGCVGETAAKMFMGWLRDMDIPDPEDVLKDPNGIALPEQGHKLRVLLEATCLTVVSDKNHTNYKNRWKAAWAVLLRCKDKKDIIYNCARLMSKVQIPPGEKLPEVIHEIFKIRNSTGIND